MEETGQALSLNTRKKIFQEIKASPGLHFRELLRRTELGLGTLQYHVEVLQKEHLVSSRKEGKFVRFYAVSGMRVEQEQKTMSLLRKKTSREIVMHLLQKKKASNQSIAQELKLAPSTISENLQSLMREGVVEKTRNGKEVFFSVKEPREVASLFVDYKKSFLDEVVNGFVEIWEEI